MAHLHSYKVDPTTEGVTLESLATLLMTYFRGALMAYQQLTTDYHKEIAE